MKFTLRTDLTSFSQSLPPEPQNSLELPTAQDSAIKPKATSFRSALGFKFTMKTT
jgi:hypothetical protein